MVYHSISYCPTNSYNNPESCVIVLKKMKLQMKTDGYEFSRIVSEPRIGGWTGYILDVLIEFQAVMHFPVTIAFN